MGSDFISVLREFVEVQGPSGKEGRVSKLFADYLNKINGVSVIEERGNIIGVLAGSGPRISLIAHTDEIRFRCMAKSGTIATFEPQAFPRFSKSELRAQGFKSLPESLHILDLDEDVPARSYGVYGSLLRKPRFAIKVDLKDDIDKVDPKGILLGRPSFAINTHSLNVLDGNIIEGSPLDDRVGLTILVFLASYFSKIKPEERPNLYFVGRVKEEIGTSEACFNIKAISEDTKLVVIVDDPDPSIEVKFGDGPIVVYDKQITPQGVLNLLKRIKKDLKLFEGDLTMMKDDAGEGKPAFFIGPFMTGYHTSQERMSYKDIVACMDVLKKFLSEVKTIVL